MSHLTCPVNHTASHVSSNSPSTPQLQDLNNNNRGYPNFFPHDNSRPPKSPSTEHNICNRTSPRSPSRIVNREFLNAIDGNRADDMIRAELIIRDQNNRELNNSAQNDQNNRMVNEMIRNDEMMMSPSSDRMISRPFNSDELNLVEKLPENTGMTTIMLRNIPNKYTQKMLLEVVNQNFNGLYDFFYLPIDFRNKCNVGYAFVNFIHSHYGMSKCPYCFHHIICHISYPISHHVSYVSHSVSRDVQRSVSRVEARSFQIEQSV